MDVQDSLLLDELDELFGSGAEEVEPHELREAVASLPQLDSRKLVLRYQRLIPDLLRRGIWFQKDGLRHIRLLRLRPRHVPPACWRADFATALAYVNCEEVRHA